MSKKIIFDNAFFEKGTDCFSVDKVYLKNGPEKLIFDRGNVENNFKSGICILDDVPPFVNIEFHEDYEAYKLTHHSALDFYVDLKGYSEVQEYLKTQMGSKSRSRLRGLVNRLEKCFDISYKIYFGEITKAEYDLLFKYLKLFIEERFSQRGDKHQAMKEWSLYKERTFGKILKKEASLFVIYNNDRPIDICLNYHVGNVFVNKIRSFDIDYSKFRLGYIDIIKQLEWCLDNDYVIFDLMRGDLRYKREFCNNIINFDRYILYKRNSLSGKLMAYLKTKELVLRPKLKFVKTAFRKVLKKKESDVNSEPNEPTETIIINLSEFPKDIEVELIDINQKEYALLRKGVYDYQYSTSEHSNGIQIFKIKDVPNSYIIKGQSNMVQMEI